MKILLFAHERPAAELVSRALRRIAPDATLAWARSPDAALNWLGSHRDADAVIVDAGIPRPHCRAFLEEVRGLAGGVATAVVAPEHFDTLCLAGKANLDAAAGQDRARNDFLEEQLRELQEWRAQAQQRLTQAQAEHEGALSRSTRICTILQERLLEIEGALERADRRHAEQTATAEQLARREHELAAALVEAASIRTAIEGRLAASEAAHGDARQSATRDLAAAGERQAALEDRLSREAEARASLEQHLAAVANARESADQQHAAEIAAITTRLADREAHHQASFARTNRICTALQERLLDLESAGHAADERHAGDAAE